MQVTEVQSPTIEYGLLAPMLVVFGAAVLGVLVEAFLPRTVRYPVQVVLSLAALAIALGMVVTLADRVEIAAEGSVAIDGPTLFIQGTVLALSLLSVLLFAERRVDPGGAAFASAA
ncbi:MAG: NADH-quinone oxidoreductase subunit N, partial [Actinomycetota bacterium]|nr:NADH-quinone oxidoreductase subunit N [Actinomycetota bacterium]